MLALFVSPSQNTGTYYSMGEQTGGCLYREPNSGRIIRACDSEVESHFIWLNIFSTWVEDDKIYHAGPDRWWSVPLWGNAKLTGFIALAKNTTMQNLMPKSHRITFKRSSVVNGWLHSKTQTQKCRIWSQNLMEWVPSKVCEDISGPETCIDPPEAVSYGFKNRLPT